MVGIDNILRKVLSHILSEQSSLIVNCHKNKYNIGTSKDFLCNNNHKQEKMIPLNGNFGLSKVMKKKGKSHNRRNG